MESEPVSEASSRDRPRATVALVALAFVALAALTFQEGTGAASQAVAPGAAADPALGARALAPGLLLGGLSLLARCFNRERTADVGAVLVFVWVGLCWSFGAWPARGQADLGDAALVGLTLLASEMPAAGTWMLSLLAFSLLLAPRASLPGRVGAWATALVGGLAVLACVLAVPGVDGPVWGGGRLPLTAATAFLLGGIGLSLEAAHRQGRSNAAPSPLTPYVAAALALLAGGLLWQILTRHEEQSLVRITELAATEMAKDVAQDAESLRIALSLAGGADGADGEADDDLARERWSARSRLLLSRFPALMAVELVDASAEPVVRVTRPDVSAESFPTEAPLSRVSEPWLSPAFRIGAQPAVRLLVPVSGREMISGVIDVRSLLEGALARKDRMHSVRIAEGEIMLFESHPPDRRVPVVQRPLRLAPSGSAWTIAVASAPSLAAAVRSPLPYTALALASIIALLVALAIRTARSEHRKALELSRANEQLGVEIGERRRAELELRRLNRELDERVRSRTEELSRVVDQVAAENRARRRVLAHLERMNASLRQFDGFISHELRQPLGALQIWVDLLEANGGDLSDKGRGYVGKAKSEIRRMAKMIETELRLSQATHGEAPTDPVALGPLLDGLVADLRERLQEIGARIEVGTLPAVFADPDQSRQVFANLIENSMKYRRPEVPLVIHVEERARPSSDDLCEIVVRDNGLGFDGAAAETLFEAFRRASEHPSGAGLGLAICRRIAEHHGGSIRAEGTPGSGATFYLRLPCAGPA